jgi:hypothetical protein
MPLKERQAIMKKIEEIRGGRTLVCFFNFDRPSEPQIRGLRTSLTSDTKEALFRVLKETAARRAKIDFCLYTGGGETNAVWPIISLLREYDKDFEVLVPFRCYSAGTLLALAGKKIVMTPISDLSPIDPSTGNQFNPVDPVTPGARLVISVEDVQAYREFVHDQFKFNADEACATRALWQPFLDRLVQNVHPIALGNVHRVHQLIKRLAKKILGLHRTDERQVNAIIEALTSSFFSHLHMINRHEAREILGPEQVDFASKELTELLDELLRAHVSDFNLRKTFFLGEHLKDELTADARFIGAAIESKKWGYLYETRARLRQRSVFPPNVQVQIPAGQILPLVPGLKREYDVEITSLGWVRNVNPKGVTK